MGLTKAERHNRMMDKVFNHYNQHQNSLPPCELYSRFLSIAEEKLSIDREQARKQYGHLTVKQWESLLKLGWNKD